MGMNQSQSLWGEDALEFKYGHSLSTRRKADFTHDDCRPERWNNPPAGIESVPGMWGNVLSFGYGPRGCIGFRFAVDECVVPSLYA